MVKFFGVCTRSAKVQDTFYFEFNSYKKIDCCIFDLQRIDLFVRASDFLEKFDDYDFEGLQADFGVDESRLVKKVFFENGIWFDVAINFCFSLQPVRYK